MKGRTRCYRHGGASPAGIASPHWKGRGFSKHLPTGMVADFRRALADPDLLDLSGDLALIEAQLAQAVRATHAGDVESAWRRFRDAWSRFATAHAADDEAGSRVAIAELQALYDDGPQPFDASERIDGLLERRRKLVATEQRRRVTMRELVAGERFMAFVAAVAESVRRHVPDQAARQAITFDMAAMLGTTARPAALASDGSDV